MSFWAQRREGHLMQVLSGPVENGQIDLNGSKARKWTLDHTFLQINSDNTILINVVTDRGMEILSFHCPTNYLYVFGSEVGEDTRKGYFSLIKKWLRVTQNHLSHRFLMWIGPLPPDLLSLDYITFQSNLEGLFYHWPDAHEVLLNPPLRVKS